MRPNWARDRTRKTRVVEAGWSANKPLAPAIIERLPSYLIGLLRDTKERLRVDLPPTIGPEWWSFRDYGEHYPVSVSISDVDLHGHVAVVKFANYTGKHPTPISMSEAEAYEVADKLYKLG